MLDSLKSVRQTTQTLGLLSGGRSGEGGVGGRGRPRRKFSDRARRRRTGSARPLRTPDAPRRGAGGLGVGLPPPPAARLCGSAATGGWVATGGRKEARQGRLASGRSATLADGSRPRPAPHARPAARRRTRRAVSGSRAALSSGAAAEAEQAGQLVAVRRRQLEPRRRLRHDACRAPTGRWPQLLRAA